MSKFVNFHELLDSFATGFLKKILVGAGLTLGTTGVVLVTLNQFIDNMRDAVTQLPPFAIALADIAGFDNYLSFVLGAIMTRHVLKGSQLSLQRVKE